MIHPQQAVDFRQRSQSCEGRFYESADDIDDLNEGKLDFMSSRHFRTSSATLIQGQLEHASLSKDFYTGELHEYFCPSIHRRMSNQQLSEDSSSLARQPPAIASELVQIKEPSIPNSFDPKKTFNKYSFRIHEHPINIHESNSNQSPGSAIPNSSIGQSPTSAAPMRPTGAATSNSTRSQRRKQAKEMKMPLVVVSQTQFYGSTKFEPEIFNAWYRQDGWEPPVHIFMVFHWISWVFLGLGFWGFLLAFVPSPFQPVTLAVSIIIAFIQFGATIYTMSVDPQDPAVKNSGIERNIHYVKALGFPVIDRETFLCGVCNVVVAADTKHCKPCNKCVAKFETTKSFFITVLLAFIVSGVFSGFGLYVFSLYFTNFEHWTSIVSSHLSLVSPLDASTEYSILSVILFYSICGTAICITIFSLLQFHIRLMILNLTTIEFLEITSGHGRKWRNGKRIETNATLKIVRVVGEFFAGICVKRKQDTNHLTVLPTGPPPTTVVADGGFLEEQQQRERQEPEWVVDKDDYESEDFDSIDGGVVEVNSVDMAGANAEVSDVWIVSDS
ncbi:hypothetical protein BDR26DRAFT_885432 [Obelidium mucronatum]|nr:hypothetical protein BDR26DRAFT_885432 [Obelidium mucronatum]